MRRLSLLALLLVAGCGTSAGTGGGQVACTEIGAPRGVSVDLAPGPAAAAASTAALEACWAGKCRTYPLELSPSTEAIDTGCGGDQPDAVCSAEVRETGGKHGFATVDDLPELPVRVTLTITGDDGAETSRQTLDITPEPVYPNGPHCPAMGPQAKLTVDADGTVRDGT
ncbi:hypothetical protein BAY59_02415 [Prauserella coralliicola]|nr:hypothetical protein BAY59_02415 [Prauserella coralliicola]